MNHRTFGRGIRWRGRLAVLVLLFLCAALTRPWPARAQAPDPPRWLLELFSWVAAVNTHVPGQADAAIGAGADRRLADLEDILADVLAIRDRLDSVDSRDGAAGQGVTAYRGHSFTASQLRRLTGLGGDEPLKAGMNRLLRRAAVYHADVALVTSQTDAASGRAPSLPGRSAVVVGDGRQQRAATSTVHWAFGRRLLEHLVPGPSRDPFAREWYLATAATMQSLRMLSEADDHLSRARQLFPGDARLVYEGACALESLTAPTVQAAMRPPTEGPRPSGSFRVVSTQPSASGLRDRAEQLFRRALQADPTLAEARVRLARLTAARGQHAEAIAELQRALAAQPANDVRYLALMLLGDEVQAIGRRGEAKEHYEAAAALYPTAQSPLLALGLLAREGGDRRAAIAALDRISRLPADPEARIDPSWAYYLMQGRDADRLMQRLYALTGTEAR